MTGALLMVYGFVTLTSSLNAARPVTNPTSRFPAIWLWAMLVGEYAGPLLGARTIIGVVFVSVGALANPAGVIGLWFLATAQLIHVGVWLLSRADARAARRSFPNGRTVEAHSWRERLTRRPATTPPGTELVCAVEYGSGCTVDVYRPIGPTPPTAAIVYVHGGSWTSGDPHRQSRTLFHHFAAHGWQVFAVRYPLHPRPTFPANVEAVMQAVRWVQGLPAVDPGRVVLAGGSAGAHLATLAALRINMEPEGRVAACVPLYGVFDLANRNRTRPHWEVIPRAVIGATLAEAPERYRAASPLDQIHPGAPPMLVIHGTYDSLVPPHESEQFFRALTVVSDSETHYLPMRGAQHAFDAIKSPRTKAVVSAIDGWVSGIVAVPTPPTPKEGRAASPPDSVGPTPGQPSGG